MDVVLNLHIGYVLSRQMRQRLLMDGRQVARLYLVHGTLIVDILAIIPVIPEARRCLRLSSTFPLTSAGYVLLEARHTLPVLVDLHHRWHRRLSVRRRCGGRAAVASVCYHWR